MFDPLRATYRYERTSDPGDSDRIGGYYGSLYIDGELVFHSWQIDASVDCFEADPCSCGVEGCGLLDVRVHRWWPYVVWTGWVRRSGEPDFSCGLPLVMGVERYERALGGSTEGLPVLGAPQAQQLLRLSEPWEGEVLWWDGNAPGWLDAVWLMATIHERGESLYDEASLVPCPADVWTLCNERGDALLWASEVDGALAVRWGALERCSAMLRLPRLVP